MKQLESTVDAQALMREVRRYLAVVDAFRAEHCEPVWLAEVGPGAAAIRGAARSQNRAGGPRRQKRS